MILLLVFMQLTRDLFAIAKFLLVTEQHNLASYSSFYEKLHYILQYTWPTAVQKLNVYYYGTSVIKLKGIIFENLYIGLSSKIVWITTTTTTTPHIVLLHLVDDCVRFKRLFKTHLFD